MIFTIVLPTYREPELALHTLHTILQQRGVGLNVIVCDDSPDDSVRRGIAALADPRVHYIKNESHLGAVPNWNHGLREALKQSSDAIIVMHHDDEFAADDALFSIAKTFEMTGAGIVISAAEVKLADGASYRVSPPFMRRLTLRCCSALFLYNTIGPCAAVAFRPQYIQFFDERLHWFVDVDWYYRLLSSKVKSALNNTITILSRHGHEGQITVSIHVSSAAKADAAVLARQPHITWIARLTIGSFIHVLHNATINRFIKILLHR